jgi:hypothetical protein
VKPLLSMHLLSRAPGTRTRMTLLALLGVVTLTLAAAPRSLADTPWWGIRTEVVPTYLSPQGTGYIVVRISNLGDETAHGDQTPIVIADRLPAGLKATEITAEGKNEGPVSCSLTTLQCTFTGVLYPYQQLGITIAVSVEASAGADTELVNDASVEGGGGARVVRSHPISVSEAPTPVGVQAGGYEVAPFNEDGTAAASAGTHPFQLTTTLVMNQVGTAIDAEPTALPRNLRFNLPPGLVGNPTAVTQCSETDFDAVESNSAANLCAPNTVVGVASVTIDEPKIDHVASGTVPVFNLVPAQGEPARFGFEVLGFVFVAIDTSVRTGSDYGVVASVKNTTQSASLLSSQVTLWGDPGDPRHNQSRGWECVAGGETHVIREGATLPCPSSSVESAAPFLTLPTACAANPAREPFESSMEMEAWTQPGVVSPPAYIWSDVLGEPLGFQRCQDLPFSPGIETMPQQSAGQSVHRGGVPSGLGVDVRVPQGPTTESNPGGVGEADVRDTTVTLPRGVGVNPSAANGLAGCPEGSGEGTEYEGVGFEGFKKVYGDEREPAPEAGAFSRAFRFVEEDGRKPSCPDASKVGTVRIKTPLLPKELEGALYLAEPAPNGEVGKNPFNSLLAFYLVAEDKDAGILVKFAGEGRLDPVTGQVSTIFRDTPQLPFEELKVELFGGQRASLSTPGFCGGYQTEGVFTPWSVPFGGPATTVFSSGGEFQVTENCAVGSSLGFAPGFGAQSQSVQAGGFTGFVLGLERGDGQQQLSGLSVHLPPGISALLSSLTPCQEPAVGQPWSCGPGSLIGHSLAASGVGSEPVTLPGNVYLTTGYDGAPFGILDETETKAGPFDLGEVYVRSRINVDPNTAAVTITTDPGPHGDSLPTILKGVPVDLKQLSVTVDRQGFELNPTSCNRMGITGTLDGGEGAQAGVSSPFQVGGCEALPFSPGFTASAVGAGSKANGTTFAVTVASTGVGSGGDSQAGIAKVDLQLPKQLSSRLATLQKACLAVVFEANPSACPEGSVIGNATIHTPVLNNPLSGPAYLVSHGNAGFPDVEFVLQGEGITLLLDGHTDIKQGITYSKFESTPDAPFTRFETILPAGPHGVLTPNVPESKHFSLCGEKLTMPTTIVAQNGKTLQQNTKVTIQGCGAVKANKAKKLTRAQLLAKALKACRTKYKHHKHKRAQCEKRARKKYTPHKKLEPTHKKAKQASHEQRRLG